MQMLQRNITLEENPKAFLQFAASMHNDENTDGRRAMCWNAPSPSCEGKQICVRAHK